MCDVHVVCTQVIYGILDTFISACLAGTGVHIHVYTVIQIVTMKVVVVC